MARVCVSLCLWVIDSRLPSSSLSQHPLAKWLLCGTGVKVLVSQPPDSSGQSHVKDAEYRVGKRSCCRVTALLILRFFPWTKFFFLYCTLVDVTQF